MTRLVPGHAPVFGDGALQTIEQLVRALAGLASLQVDRSHAWSLPDAPLAETSRRRDASEQPAVIGTEADIVVDNSAGGDSDFAAEVARLLSTRGLAVEVRSAPRELRFDTGVHLVSAGIAIRVSRMPERSLLSAIEQDVRAALLRRPSERRRTRSVPVHLADTARVLEWIDIFD